MTYVCSKERDLRVMDAPSVLPPQAGDVRGSANNLGYTGAATMEKVPSLEMTDSEYV